MKELTYADIRKMALEHGIKDTRLHIGLWASDRYIKETKNDSRQDVHGLPAVSQTGAGIVFKFQTYFQAIRRGHILTP